jgi:hypothetical protein
MATALSQLRSAGDVPRSPLRRRLRDRLVVGCEVLVEALAHVEVVAAELPALLGVVDSLLEPDALLVLADVQEHLDERGALVGEQRSKLRMCPDRRRQTSSGASRCIRTATMSS